MDRKNIGILLLGGNEWVGGLYYVLNIIRSLSILEEERKPNLIVFYGNDVAKSHLDEINYPYITKVDYNPNFPYKLWHKGIAEITGNDSRIKKLCSKYQLDAIYPYNYTYRVKTPSKIVAWFPDFQHKFLTHLFSNSEINRRDDYLNKIQKTRKHIVFSSKDACSHYEKFYPNSSLNRYVLPFVSNVITNNLVSKELILDKYNISEPYFIVSNQFWEHKNHFVILRALQELRLKHEKVLIIFTGKEHDHRNPEYFPSIKKYVEENQLQAQTVFLGFISRTDQLSLLHHSLAVIQPSKFEGWGSVVEDAKTLGKQTIVSDIPVHHEQLGDNALYFNADNHSGLAEILLGYMKNEISCQLNYVPVEKRMLSFANTFLKIMDDSQSNG